MIECPYCRTTLTETSGVCPSCHLELERVKSVLGPAPGLSHRGITDFTGSLSRGEERRIARAVKTFHDHFPQSHLAVVFQEFSKDFPLGTHLFWLFNTSGLPGGERKWGKNRDVLIGIDPERRSAGLTVGYGLEPFLPQSALDHIMHLALPMLETDEFAAGALEIIRGLSRLMEGVCRDLGDILGLDYTFAVEEKPGEY